MKVSNNVDVARIYQEQLKKNQNKKTDGDFRSMMEKSVNTKTEKPAGFKPPSGVDLSNPVLSGPPAPKADPMQTVKYAAEVVANEPEVRADKVDRLKQLIDSGQYNIPAEKVAERLLSSGILTTSLEG